MKAAYWFLQGTTQSIPALSDVVMYVRMYVYSEPHPHHVPYGTL